MKKIWIVFGMILSLLWVAAAEDVMVEVTGDRVSLRAAPELNAVLLTRANLGEKLILRDNTNPDWVGVLPPERIDFWVHNEFIQDGEVLPAHLNIRSGPSLNHTVVGVVRGGRVLTVRGTISDWVKIAPPEETVAWISRTYCDLAVDPAVEAAEPAETNTEQVEKPQGVIQIVPASEPVPAIEVQEPVVTIETAVQPEINEVLVTATKALDESQVLSPDLKKTQGANWSFTGLLKPEKGLLSKLVDADTGQILICYVRGNEAQMKACEGKRVSIFGRTYWALGLERPMVVPVTIQVLEDKAFQAL